MSETKTEASSMQAEAVAGHPPRRPRVREVSSRFMSPVVVHSSSSSSPARHQHQRSTDADDNRPETFQCSERETPLRSVSQFKRVTRTTFKENGGGGQHRRSKSSEYGNSSRPDTPMTMTIEDRLAPGRLRIGALNSQRSNAARLLRSSGIMPFSGTAETPDVDSASISSTSDDSGTCPVSSQGSTCTTNTPCSSPIRAVHKSKTQRSLADLRSSMPEADMLPTRLLSEKNGSNDDSLTFRDSPCSRSLNFQPLSNCENSLYHSVKTSEKVANFVKTGGGGGGGGGGGLYMPPPRPPRAKLSLEDARKGGRKVSSHQEDVHSLRLLHNHYLQWRYANAKADVSMLAQRREAERTLYSLGEKVSDLRNSVRRKRMELELLRRTKNLSTILEAQMPDLDEWSAFEGDYSISLSETIQALVNASLQLPISGNVRADTKEVGEALNSASKVMDMIAFHVQSFVPKAEEMENLISKLAGVFGGESTLVEDCGELLSKTYASQVEECSLRGQLIQLQRSSSIVQSLE